MDRTRRFVLTFGAAALAAPLARAAEPAALEIGARPDDFTLEAPDGAKHGLKQEPMPKATVVLFLSTKCPVTRAYDERMKSLAREYGPKGVRFLGINSNSNETMVEVGEHAKSKSYGFPVVKDLKHVAADRLGARVTPEAFVLDSAGALRYRGRIDSSRNEENVTSRELKDALDALLAGKAPEKTDVRAFGLSIKRD